MQSVAGVNDDGAWQLLRLAEIHHSLQPSLLVDVPLGLFCFLLAAVNVHPQCVEVLCILMLTVIGITKLGAAKVSIKVVAYKLLNLCI